MTSSRHGASAATLARAFVDGRLEVEGDLVAAVRRAWDFPSGWLAAWSACIPWVKERLAQSPRRAEANIRAHYDHPVEFYREFLDERLVYSCAYFREAGWTLEEAQLAKLDLICRKLGVERGHRFLDVGCGWGGLLEHAAAACGAAVTGCTLSPRQAEYAARRLNAGGVGGRVLTIDYRRVGGPFDRIASVGMFEHVGRRGLSGYFNRMHRLLAPGGLFLNHGITRPENVREPALSVFWRQAVFPGSQLVHLSEEIAAAERAGFEVLDVENLRRHYALTCQAWAGRLRAHRDACLAVVDERTWRRQTLFLAASAVSFEKGWMDVHQVLLAPRDGAPGRPFIRQA